MSAKNSNYQEFKIGRDISVTAWTYETRYSWGHKADLYIDNRLVESKKITYYNRTWERFTYESILECLAGSKSLTEKQSKKFKKYIVNYGNADLKRVNSEFKTIATIAKMGEFFADDQKGKNDWKTRMLRAGLGDKGLEFPEDWDTLSEAEKETRLNRLIAMVL